MKRNEEGSESEPEIESRDKNWRLNLAVVRIHNVREKELAIFFCRERRQMIHGKCFRSIPASESDIPQLLY